MEPPLGPTLVATPCIDPAKVVRLMLAFFGDHGVSTARQVMPEEVPPPYRRLLVHSGHMTEALKRQHGNTLAVRPYRVRRDGDLYGRRLDLLAGDDQRPLMTGIMIFNMTLVAPGVREEIEQAHTPLGQILIGRRILRRVRPDAFLRFDADDPLVRRFACDAPRRPAYGRLATIDCDQRPAVDLLEIVRP